MKGITEYIPITFKGVYFSVAHGIFHTSLLDFKWRDQSLVEITNDYDENGVYVEEETPLSQYERDELRRKYSYPPSCLEDYLLGSENDFYQHKIRKSTLEHLFDVFVSPMIQNWENVKRSYETLITEERESISTSFKPLTKLETKSSDLEFWAIKNWKQYVGQEETKYQGKENMPIEMEQAEVNNESEDEDDMNVGDEDNAIQKVYSVIDVPREFYLNYIELKNAFVKRVYSKNSSGLVKNIETELNGIAGQIVRCNYELLMLIGAAPEQIREHFRDKHWVRIKERVEDSVFKSCIKTKNLVISGDEDNREIYKIMAEKRRSNVYKELLDDLPIEDMSNLTHETTPVMIEEVFELEGKSTVESDLIPKATSRAKQSQTGYHLFVLVHGYQATSIDMQEIKNHIAMVVPNSTFLWSEANEGKGTEGWIEEMGENLADEVKLFFEDDEDVGEEVTKITFIGHSMGGIIIRWALPHLYKYRKMMHGFWTLSSPHLGYATCK